ncbi:uncharacterized protein LOC114935389 isoform X1 [Nylanderia fulva]|uniref:uncharacterized protein LOC114935389 isoform X1 n=1 Tax=Nylanderia fulva TaxID=613905 RepID=UPI0010FB4509|nr:uncharacterized protein LOC114935389 isoform X1 [Nylanderia fulva]
MNTKSAREIEKTIKQGRFRFAMKCLHKVMEVNPNRNLIFSPPCIYNALFLTHFLIKGAIEERLKLILCLGIFSKTDFMNYCSYKKSKGEIWMLNSETCINDIRCWINHNIEDFPPKIAKTISYLFEEPIISLEICKTCKQTKIGNVNRLLKKSVDGFISEPVRLPDDEQDIILMTSISHKFQNLSASNTIVPQRDYRVISYFNHELSIHVTDVPYQHESISLLMFSPASIISGVWKIIENISHSDFLNFTKQLSTMNGISKLRKLLRDLDASRKQNSTNSQQFLPFEVEKNLTILELLEALKVEQLLTYELDVISGKSSVQIRNAVHRSHIKAARREVIVGAMTLINSKGENSPSDSKIIDVSCNNPFVWMIYDLEHQEILFIGACNSAETNCQNISMNIDQASPLNSPQAKKPRSE